ncbi:uncharacterized protein LOC143251700 [Tachypleus tridentatus]|uniref:uncharacterized protein LOC143251700 n=1 Tax=Tachypleus tridentatus TaxID=6853 RepID=UPI003FD385B1
MLVDSVVTDTLSLTRAAVFATGHLVTLKKRNLRRCPILVSPRTRLTMRNRVFFRYRPLRDFLVLTISFAFISCYLSYVFLDPLLYFSPHSDQKLPSFIGVSGALQRNILSQNKKSTNLNTSKITPTREISKLEKLLSEIETTALEVLQVKQKIAIVRGQRCAITRDLPLYEKVLQNYSFFIERPSWYEDQRKNRTRCCFGKRNARKNPVQASSWRMRQIFMLFRTNIATSEVDGGDSYVVLCDWTVEADAEKVSSSYTI